jgi:anti-sigma regulatory factor (Ser/Thr protein kinase)
MCAMMRTARSASWALPPVARSVVEARRHVRATLADWQLDALSDAAQLLTSEVVTNSLLHARSPIRLTVEHTETGVRIAVTDGSTVVPSVRPRSTSATTGRGLLLLSRLAEQWDTETSDGGKTVWFTLSSDRDPWQGLGDADSPGEAR